MILNTKHKALALLLDPEKADLNSLPISSEVHPDYIFVGPRGNEEKALASFEELFTSNPGWDTLTAVSEGNYYLLSKELFGLKPNADWGEAYREAYELLYGE